MVNQWLQARAVTFGYRAEADRHRAGGGSGAPPVEIAPLDWTGAGFFGLAAATGFGAGAGSRSRQCCLRRRDRTLQELQFSGQRRDLIGQTFDLGLLRLLRRQQPFGRLHRSCDLLLEGLQVAQRDGLGRDRCG